MSTQNLLCLVSGQIKIIHTFNNLQKVLKQTGIKTHLSILGYTY